MSINRKITASESEKSAHATRRAATQTNKMRITPAGLIRRAGLPAMITGIIFIGIQPIHPPDALSSVTTTAWVIIQSLKFTMCLLGLLGITGLYARQVEAAGWLGLTGYLLFSLFYALTAPFVFAEAFILPLLATEAPKFVEGFLGIITGAPAEVSLGALPAFFALSGLGYMLGSLLFGIATFRAGILPRGAAVLLACSGPLAILIMQLLGHPLDRMAAAPMGIALIWLGYALWSDRRVQVAASMSVMGKAQSGETGAD